MMLKDDKRTDFAFAEILDRARDLNRELVRSGSETREVKVSVTDDATPPGKNGAVGKCTVTVKADTIKEAKAAFEHLTGEGHKCTCTRKDRTVRCECP